MYHFPPPAAPPELCRARRVDEPASSSLEALRGLRRHYAHLLSNLPGVVYRCEAAAPWRIHFISHRVRELTGRRREEFEQGLGWAEIVHPDDLASVVRAVDQTIGQSQQFTITYRVIHASGAVLWVREQGQAIAPDPSGAVYLEGFIQDVTQEKALEHSLRAAEAETRERWRALQEVLESTSDCVYSLDENWQLTFLNENAKAHFGDAADLIGRPVLSLFPDAASDFRECLRTAMHSREPAFAEGYLESRQTWYEVHAAPTPGGITVFFRDTTERRQLEEAEKAAVERWRVALNQIPQMVWSMAGGARLPDFYNDRWYEFTGLPPGSLSGPEWLDLFHPDDREPTLEKWRRCRASGAPYEAEYRVRNSRGEYRWVVSKAQAELDAQGNVLRWYGTCTDIHERFLDQAALESSERLTRTILNSVPQVIWCANPKGALEFLSEQWTSFSGIPAEVLGGLDLRELVHPQDRVAAFRSWATSVRTGQPYEVSFRILRTDGEYIWALVRAIPERDGAGAVLRWFGTCTNIHEQVTAQHSLSESEALSRGIIEASPDCISLLDRSGTVLYVNTAALEAYGERDARRLIGTTWGSAFRSRARAMASEALEQAKRGGVGRLVISGGPTGDRWYDVAVAPVLGSGGEPKNFIAISRDFTQRKEAEEKAQWTANHDVLTSLPNRFLFNRRLEAALADMPDACGFSLLLFDVDHLKHVNDAMGHDAGDALLKEVARRLSNAVREGDTVARLGGDEFAILLPGIRTREELGRMAASLREQLVSPFSFSGRLVDCHASMGGSIFPLHAQSKAELMKAADIALYVAKEYSRGQLQVFETSMRDQMQRRLSMLSLANAALKEHRIVPHYQPKIDLSQGIISGFEALLRWRDSSGRLQLPGQIAAAFDDVELASAVSDEMIAKVLDDAASWTESGVPFGHVALNAGAVELRRHDFVDALLERLRERHLPPEAVQLEVTETVFLGRGSGHIQEALQRLSSAGVRIALDDFGTGYASLSHLNKHPVDFIKIDRSFVENIGSASTSEPIVDAVIGLGRSLGIEVVAEGIETPAQHAFLMRRGCHYAQGFLYSAAVPAEQVPGLIAWFDRACGRPPAPMVEAADRGTETKASRG